MLPVGGPPLGEDLTRTDDKGGHNTLAACALTLPMEDLPGAEACLLRERGGYS